MPLLLYGLIGMGGAFIGSLANNATAPSPIVAPQDDTLNVANVGKAFMYGAAAIAVVWASKKYLR